LTLIKRIRSRFFSGIPRTHMMSKKILLSPPIFNGNEQSFIASAFSVPHISTYGDFLDRFEFGLMDFSNGCHVAVTNSGTSALHLAMRLIGIKSGDEVICQSFTFCASANPICYQGALPVFVDSESETWNMDPVLLEEAIIQRLKKGKKPKAIVVVDLYGMPAKFDQILSLADKYQIPVIEDAAEALGSKYKGKFCSSFGAFGVFSFNGNKIITTGSGGCLVSSDSEAIKKAKYLALQAKDNVHFYRHQEIGYNYCMSNLSAAVGLGQLEKLEEKVRSRRKIFERYVQMFSDFEGIDLLAEPEGVRSNRWLSTITIDKAVTGFDHEDVRQALAAQQIESRYLWNPLHLQPIFKGYPYFGGNVAESLFNRGLCLPSGEMLSELDQERIVGIIKSLRKV
jgi:dTDP-4-amino-4,6-dideoxygalactose transaminase